MASSSHSSSSSRSESSGSKRSNLQIHKIREFELEKVSMTMRFLVHFWLFLKINPVKKNEIQIQHVSKTRLKEENEINAESLFTLENNRNSHADLSHFKARSHALYSNLILYLCCRSRFYFESNLHFILCMTK